MSFFMRGAVVLALVAGAVHVFRKDLVRISSALRGPAQNFVKEVSAEMQKQKEPALPAPERPVDAGRAPAPATKEAVAAEDKKMA
jgi:hypothetical protein